jgi:hypothetical protein
MGTPGGLRGGLAGGDFLSVNGGEKGGVILVDVGGLLVGENGVEVPGEKMSDVLPDDPRPVDLLLLVAPVVKLILPVEIDNDVKIALVVVGAFVDVFLVLYVVANNPSPEILVDVSVVAPE